MLTSRQKIVALLLVAFLAISILNLGCTPQRKPEQQTPAPRNNTTSDPARSPMSGPQDNANEREQRVTEKIKKDVPEVRDVSIVFSDRVVYAAVSLDQDISEKRAKDIENLVSESIMDEENTVDRVYVSLDPETFQRLKGVAGDVENGKPISGTLNQIEEWFARVTPTNRR